MAQSSSPSTHLCPTCGARITPGMERCQVCGHILTGAASPKNQPLSGPKKGVTLSLPIFLLILVVFLGVDAGLIFFAFRGQAAGAAGAPTRTPTITQTPTTTVTPTPTNTATPQPTATPLPDVQYKVSSGDTCLSIALTYHVSVLSIVDKNNLSQACDTLSVGQVLMVPQPTPTASPQPTGTPGATEAARANCEVADYEVVDGDTLGRIASIYNVAMADIQVFNGMMNDTVMVGNHISIPLCKRKAEDGSTATPTSPPDYPSTTLLLPKSGAVYTGGDLPGLQWSSVGTLRENEAYAITVVDITTESQTGQRRRLSATANTTQYSLPANFKPTDDRAHIMQWWIQPVRQTGSDQSGNPIWKPAGPVSEIRQFVWSGK